MKRFFAILMLVLLVPAMASAAARPDSQKGTYTLSCLTGGTQGCLDELDQTGDGDGDITDGTPNRYDLIEADSAIVTTISGSTVSLYFYVYDADGTDAEDSPTVIRPDDYSSSGVWRLCTVKAVGFTNEPSDDPYTYFDELTGTDWWLGVDDTGNSFEIRTNSAVGNSVRIEIDEDGDIHITGDVYIVGDDLFMGTNTDGMVLVADGTNFNPVQVTGDVEMTNAGVTTIQPNAVDSSMINTIVDSIAWNAAGMNVDGTQCADPTDVTINSGPIQHTIICADNDGSTMYGHVIMPDSWDGGTVTFEGEYLQTAADTSALNSDVAMMCRGAGETVNNTWGSEIALDDAAVTGSNAVDHTTTAAITPNGTCAGGDTLYWRWQLDATGTTTAVATLHFLGAKVEYTSNVGD